MLLRRRVPHFIPSCGFITTYITEDFIKIVFLRIMLVLCLMLSETYCVQNYADIIGLGLIITVLNVVIYAYSFTAHHCMLQRIKDIMTL